MKPSVYTVEELAADAAKDPFEIDGDISAVVFEDDDKNDWIVWAVSPLEQRNFPDTSTVDLKSKATIDNWNEMVDGTAEEFGFHRTDRTVELKEGSLFVPTHAVETEFGTNPIRTFLGIPQYAYAKKV